MPSLATISTGLYLSNMVFLRMIKIKELPLEVPTLAETLRESDIGHFTQLVEGLVNMDIIEDMTFFYIGNLLLTADLQINKTIEFLKTHEDEPNFVLSFD